MQLGNHKTKIVATFGPASQSPEVMRQMLGAGMDVARINFSHGDFDSHQRVMSNLRQTSQAAGLMNVE
jgi:pyruvate kinase